MKIILAMVFCFTLALSVVMVKYKKEIIKRVIEDEEVIEVFENSDKKDCDFKSYVSKVATNVEIFFVILSTLLFILLIAL